MSDCCNSQAETNQQGDSCCATPAPRKAPCPRCGQESPQVNSNTLLHQLHSPFNRELKEEGYYFCESPDCKVVYFDLEGHSFEEAQLRQAVGQKSRAADRMLCYCFDIRADQVKDEIAQHGHSPSKDFVVRMTKAQRCACDLRNPAGRCCLKDFPK